MVIEKTRTSNLQGLISRTKKSLRSSTTSREQKKILRRLLTLGRGILRQLKNTTKSMDDVELFDLIKQHAPEGTSDQEIEIMKVAVTAAILRGLGAFGNKLKSLIGRVMQRFRGNDGVWITRRGKRVFIDLDESMIVRPRRGPAMTARDIAQIGEESPFGIKAIEARRAAEVFKQEFRGTGIERSVNNALNNSKLFSSRAVTQQVNITNSSTKGVADFVQLLVVQRA